MEEKYIPVHVHYNGNLKCLHVYNYVQSYVQTCMMRIDD